MLVFSNKGKTYDIIAIERVDMIVESREDRVSIINTKTMTPIVVVALGNYKFGVRAAEEFESCIKYLVKLINYDRGFEEYIMTDEYLKHSDRIIVPITQVNAIRDFIDNIHRTYSKFNSRDLDVF